MHIPRIKLPADVPEIDDTVLWALSKQVTDSHTECNHCLSSMHATGTKPVAEVLEIDEHVLCALSKQVTDPKVKVSPYGLQL